MQLQAYVLFVEQKYLEYLESKLNEEHLIWMSLIAYSYKNGTITKKLLEKICYENGWTCKFDNQGGVFIWKGDLYGKRRGKVE